MAEPISQDVLARAFELQRQAAAKRQADEAAAAQAAAEQAARTAPRSLGQVGQDAGLQLLQGAVGLGQAAYGLGNIATAGFLDRGVGLSDNFQQTNQYLNSLKSPQTQAAQQQAQQAFDQQGIAAGLKEYVTSPALLQDLAVSNLPSLIPGAAGARAAATAAGEYAAARGLSAEAASALAASRAEGAVLRTTAGQTAGAVNVDAINQIQQAGGDETQQQLGGLGAGLLAGAAAPLISKVTGAAGLESAAANALPGGARGLSLLGNAGVARGVLSGVAKEGAEETLQSGTEQLAQNAFTPNQDLFKDVAQQAAVGGLAGGLLGGAMGGVHGISSPRTETSLRDSIRGMIQQRNAEQGEPLGASVVADNQSAIPTSDRLPVVEVESGPTDVESITLAGTPLPGEATLAEQLPQVEDLGQPLPDLPQAQVSETQAEDIDLGATQVPLRSLYDITGRRPEATPAPQAATGLNAVVRRFRENSVGQPGQTWKKALADELGLKPSSMQGKVWDQFVAQASAEGMTPGARDSKDFLARVAPTLAADPASAPLFAAKLSEKFSAPAQPTATEAPVTPAAAQPLALDRQAAVALEAAAPATIQQGSTPGSPTQDWLAPAQGIDQAIAKQRSLDPSTPPAQASVAAFRELLNDGTRADLLDQYYSAVKQHPEYQALSDADKRALADDFDQRYARVEGGDPGKFNRTAAGESVARPIDSADFIASIVAANRKRGPNDAEIIALEDPSQFEMMTGQAAPPDAKGVFTDGKIYLVRQNLADQKDLALTLAHERGHQGLSTLLGDRLTAVTNRLWTNAALRDRIRGKMEYGLSRQVAAEEVLADMLASGEKVNGDVITKARAAIQNTFGTLLGYGDLRMTNQDVDKLLRDVSLVIKGASPDQVNEGDPKHLRGLTQMMADPTNAVQGDPRFSRALGDLDAIAAAAENEQGGTRRTFNDVSKVVGQAALDKVKNLGASVKTGGVFGALLDATPLNQIASLYGNQFVDGGNRLLDQFGALKRNKESGFNKVLTKPAELSYRGKETVTAAPLEIAKQWETFRRGSPAKGDALNQLQQYSTQYRLWPDARFEEQSQLDYTEHGFTETERRAAHQDIQRLYKAIGPEGQRLYKASQAVYTELWNRRFASLRNELARSTGLPVDSPSFKAAYGSMIDNALQKLRTGPYSPLQRYGDYLVTVRDAEGKIAWFSGHESKAEADAVASQLSQSEFRDQGQYRINRTARTQFDWRLDGVNQGTISKIEQAAMDAIPGDENAALRENVRGALVEAYLQSLPQQSFLQHANRRKGTAGFTMDAFRAFNDYSVKAGRSISSLDFDGQISSKLNELQNFVTEQARGDGATDTTKLQRVLNAVKSQHSASMNFERSPVADALSAGGFLWYMTSPSQLFVNSMQTPMITLPRLAGTYGNASALKAVKGALGAFVKSKGDMMGQRSALPAGGVERQVLDQLHQRGILDFTLAHDMTGLANGEHSAMSGHWRRAMEVASAFMHRSEVFNRQVTALATARLELERQGLQGNSLSEAQLNQIADKAEEAVLTTQFDYSQSNKPKLMQGPWRKAIFQFQQYRVNMLAMMAKDIRDGLISKDASPEEKATARRALGWMMGMQLAITGAAGTVLAPFAFAIADMFRDDDDLTDSRTAFIQSTPQWLSHGLLAGAFDLQRLGTDSLIPILGDADYAPKNGTPQETFNYYVMRNIGPWAGLLGGAYSGASKALDGDAMGAVKGLLPAPIRDFYKALYESQAGAKDSRQIVYYEPNVWDSLTGAMGLRSGSRRDAEDLRSAGYDVNKQAQVLTQRYLGRLAIGHATGDQDLINESNQKIMDWNRAHPDMAVKATDIRAAVINRVRAQQNAELYGLPYAKAPSESVRDALGL